MKKNRTSWFLGSVLLLILIILAGCNSNKEASNENNTGDSNGENKTEEKLTIRLGHHHAVDGTVDQFSNKFAELVKEKSNGNIEVQVFPGAQLGQEQEAIDGINMGTFEMSLVSPGLMNNYTPIFGVETLPFIFDDWEHADRALNGGVGEELRDILLENSDIRVMGYMHLGFRHMITREKPITSFEDIRGLNMRSPEAWVWVRMFELLKANPTPVTWGEAYTALQTGVVEGMETPISGIHDMKFKEVTKNLFLSQHMFGTISVVINEQAWQKASENQQKIIDDAVKEGLDYMNNEVIHPSENDLLNQLKGEGMNVVEINDMDKWREAVAPMYEEFKKDAPGADKILEMIEEAKQL